MRVLLDFHHHALAESMLQMLEDRFAAYAYFPVGMEWFDEGIWQFERAWHGDAIARQYLVGVWAQATEVEPGLFALADPRHPGRTLHGMSLARAREMPWDRVISSLPDNDAGYAAFAEQHGARFGVQLGNNHQQSRFDLASFILASTTLPGMEQLTAHPDGWGRVLEYAGVPTVVYHQSFDLQVFRPGAPEDAQRDVIASFVNCFPETPVYSAFLEMARGWCYDFDWRVYGAYGSAPADELAAGNLSVVPEIADAMRAARIGWHTKYWSDGYGHVIHNWFAVGRPVVGSLRYYRDKLAAPLFVEGVTAWDVDSYAPDELLRLLRRLRDDDDFYARACEASAARFRELVDFEREEAAIWQVLGA